MRFVIASVAVAAAVLAGTAAQAEKRLFIVANSSDGYMGVDPLPRLRRGMRHRRGEFLLPHPRNSLRGAVVP